MIHTGTSENEQITPLRLWPGVVAVVLQWLGRFVLPVFLPDFMVFVSHGGCRILVPRPLAR